MINVIGAGLAGCEAAWQCAERGLTVTLTEMKPLRRSPAHKSDGFAELVCSNSLRGDRLENAAGLLKAELRLRGSLILRCADKTRVPAGGALAVDREAFSAAVTEAVRTHPRITVVCDEMKTLPREGFVIAATGPLTDGALAEDLTSLLGTGTLSFFDASAPLIASDSVDMRFAYESARYGRGGADYINCPMDKETFLAFHAELRSAREAPVQGFDDSRVFEGCMPVEVMARRGADTLRFSAMRPIGLRDPATGKGAYAVLQLRRDNAAGTVYNMVGFQTHLAFPEQKRVFSMIPALRGAEFLQYGVMHRNSYVDAPRCLDETYRVKNHPSIRLAGQITGVEGYIESVASGFSAGVYAAAEALGQAVTPFSSETAIGALGAYIANPANGNPFRPTKIHFGLLPPLPDDQTTRDKQEKYRRISERALRLLTSNSQHRYHGKFFGNPKEPFSKRFFGRRRRKECTF
ncbi:MAG: methylenetetrahydrofolate--tRNA-(uracil(54)-C(5))-methyltransferase (FADH(2)-oxidizing) TrmFO [Oscillospiraceae bacterium]|jgi:methylenetetrahydrofolate--tRNA-(uracil-5-)-methyltransferase|nr:methylenetetrahydrofolate--tRNA-(uracil(54)-C(5))-methyltransferase (FADH(2)-oxidizing) TrmFO [Oscillospiraceae bacterium]